MASQSHHLFFSLIIIILSLSSLSFSLTTNKFNNAIDILSNSGFLSMSLTLQISPPISPSSSSSPLTIFSPSDSAFSLSGQPSLSLLKLHLSPVSLSLNSLKTLPSGSKIPTLHQNHSLTLTNNNGVALNGVKIDTSPIFSDGSLVIFGVNDFFDPNFTSLPQPVTVSTPHNLSCMAAAGTTNVSFSFHEACVVLRDEGFNVMAEFLAMQLKGFRDERLNMFTVFAPVDESLGSFSVGNYSEFSTLFLRHVVPCRVTWSDLEGFGNGTVMQSFMEGFEINVTRVDDVVMVNGVAVDFPGMYVNDWLVVHGLHKILELPKEERQGMESVTENKWDHGEAFDG